MPGAETSIEINAPASVVYDVVTDFEKYPEFVSDVKNVTVMKSGKKISAEFEVSLIKKIKYTLNFKFSPSKEVTWTFEKGDIFKDNKGSWSFEPLGKNKTKATYNIEVSFGLLVPSLITNQLVGKSLPSMMKKFKERAEKLASK